MQRDFLHARNGAPEGAALGKSLMPTMPVLPAPSPTQNNAASASLLSDFAFEKAHQVIPLDHIHFLPVKKIFDESHIAVFVRSGAHSRYLRFIILLNEAIKNKKNSDEVIISPNVQKVLDLLAKINGWIDEIPPLEGPQRFGNKAFKTWYERLELVAPEYIKDLLPSNRSDAVVELVPYFIGGFGHQIRLDYGSGHELSFVAWLCCLELLDFFDDNDYLAILTRIFVFYLEVVRRLQKVYQLEPAGSHGVWGLDDFQFLPYFWGSSQLS
ncbi:Serine/threonine-protein phosphatase 2A activator, partial [Nowakowskiella sp. JEL0078]